MARVDIRIEDGIAVVTFANPPVNALGHGVRVGLADALAKLGPDPAVKAIVLTGAGRAFSAGADITEFRSGPKAPFHIDIFNRLEALQKPVVAALNGLALGGGLELALGCHYRVAHTSVGQLGLPEVKIGILPGAGGTQRLPRLIGVATALDMIVSGAPVNAHRAREIGLVDAVAEGDVVAAAIAFARDLIAKGGGARPISAMAIDTDKLAANLFSERLSALARHPSGPLAPKNCVLAVEAATNLPFHEGLKRERALFEECAASPYAKALQYAFFAERQAANIPDIGADVAPRKVERVGIIGAGTMGTGIALAFLNAGIPVTIVEMDQTALDRGVGHIRTAIESNVKRGRISAEEGAARMGKLTPSRALDSLASADLVIEAVFETMAIKKDVFARLDRIAKSGAILATNTSTLDVDAIAAVTSRPADVIGLHFFSPANVMRLLEIVRAKATAKDVVATAFATAKRIGKVGVLARVCFGFVGNRMLEAYLEEVRAMMLEGATPAEIDGALEGFGLAMGPNAMVDLAGLDVGYRIRKERTLSNEQARLYAIADRIVEMGRLGQKSGAGYYRYAPGSRTREADPLIEQLIREEAARQGITPRKIPADEIVERCLLRLANEGARILDEGIALRSSDIDVMYLTGYGFPGWRGGPMWQADFMGLAKVAEKIRAYEARYGQRWSLAPLIARLANAGGSFAGLDAAKARA